MGTVLDEGDSPHTSRALEAAGHAAAVFRHFALSFDQMDEGQRAEYLATFSDVPEREVHLAIHEGHLVSVNRWDMPFVTGDLIAEPGLAQPACGWADQLVAAESAGATEIAYQPAGQDIPRELETFVRAHELYSTTIASTNEETCQP
jgi:5,10-methylenetetrahydromethanopterin reductase